MNTLIRPRLVLAYLLVLVAGCPQPPPTEEFCARAEECNVLPEGWTYGSCVKVFDRCVEDLPPSMKRTWEDQMDRCFELNTCPQFFQCWLATHEVTGC